MVCGVKTGRSEWYSRTLAYRSARERQGVSRSTQTQTARSLRRFAHFMLRRGRRAPATVRPEDLAAYLVWARARQVPTGPRRGRTVHLNTVLGWLQCVRGFFRWLVREQELLLDPTVALPRLAPDRSVPRILSVGEVQRLLAAPEGDDPVSERDRALLELTYSGGLRVGELVGLDIVDLDLASAEVIVRNAKGRTTRRVPIGSPAVRAVLSYLESGREALVWPFWRPDASAVFLSRHGTRWRIDLVEAMLRRRAHQARITGRITIHTLRHAAAVHLLQGGADVRSVQEFLGHASLETTSRYTRLVLDDLKEALLRSHPRSRLEM